jgi:hypothetical protein
MSLPIPNLDDISFDDLMKEAKALIPVYDKEWTNYNPSDPGITLLELFSWLCEMVIYRINQIPEVNYRIFLKLLAVDNRNIGSGKISSNGNDVIGDQTIFKKELKSGDLITAFGQTRKITSVISNSILTVNPAFDTNLPGSTGYYYLSAFPGMVSGEGKIGSGKISSDGKNVIGDSTHFKKELGNGKLIIAAGQIRKITDISSDSFLTVDSPFETNVPVGTKFSYLSASELKTGSGKISSNGKYVIGHHTRFKNEPKNGDLLIYSDQIRKITDVDSDTILTVDYPFDTNLPAGTTFSYLSAGSGTISCVENAIKDLKGDKTCFTNELKIGDSITIISTEGTEDQTRRIITIESDEKLTVDYQFHPEPSPGINFYYTSKSIDTGICEGLEALSRQYRAITTEDFEYLAMEYMETLEKGLAGRVICVNDRDLEYKKNLNTLQQGYISLIIIPRCCDNSDYCNKGLPTDELKKKIKDYLGVRKLLTTRLRVVGPDYKKVKLEVWVSLKEKNLDENSKEIIKNDIRDNIKTYFDPIKGGQDGKGWPLGRDVYCSEIFKLLEGIKGVDHGVKVVITDTDKNKILGSDENLMIEKYRLILLDPDPVVEFNGV